MWFLKFLSLTQTQTTNCNTAWNNCMRVKNKFLTQSPGAFDEEMLTQTWKIRFLINRAGCRILPSTHFPSPAIAERVLLGMAVHAAPSIGQSGQNGPAPNWSERRHVMFPIRNYRGGPYPGFSEVVWSWNGPYKNKFPQKAYKRSLWRLRTRQIGKTSRTSRKFTQILLFENLPKSA